MSHSQEIIIYKLEKNTPEKSAIKNRYYLQKTHVLNF